MTTTWTKINKATGTTWTKISKPTTLINGSPIGLLLGLTYAGLNSTSWTKIGKATGTSWTKITKAT